ncbi:MAG: calcium-binding protein [Nostoc sp. DedQUE12a]|nr:calcium-binding protein [Nostoc sp. DedQUE12a]
MARQITGTNNADRIYGTDEDDIINTLDGDDEVVSAKDGNDIIDGGSGNDKLSGAAGEDIIYGDYSPSASSDLIASGNDTIDGFSGNDKLYGQDGQDVIYGIFGDDYIEGGTDNDLIRGGDQNDILYGDDAGSPGVSGDDTIFGDNGYDRLYGGRGNDILNGNAQDDSLYGGQGYDSVNGGNGNDILIGTDIQFDGQLQQGFGFGEKDTLTGGENNDTFVLGLAQAKANDTDFFDVVLYNDGNVNANGNQDYALIKDFGFNNTDVTRGVDKIQLAGSISQYLLGTSPVGSISGTGIFFTQGQSVSELIGIVQGVSISNLSLSNTAQFIFV